MQKSKVVASAQRNFGRSRAKASKGDSSQFEDAVEKEFLFSGPPACVQTCISFAPSVPSNICVDGTQPNCVIKDTLAVSPVEGGTVFNDVQNITFREIQIPDVIEEVNSSQKGCKGKQKFTSKLRNSLQKVDKHCIESEEEKEEEEKKEDLTLYEEIIKTESGKDTSQWKKVKKVLQRYAGCTWSSPGIQQQLLEVFGEGLKIGKNVDIIKAQLVYYNQSHKAGSKHIAAREKNWAALPDKSKIEKSGSIVGQIEELIVKHNKLNKRIERHKLQSEQRHETVISNEKILSDAHNQTRANLSLFKKRMKRQMEELEVKCGIITALNEQVQQQQRQIQQQQQQIQQLTQAAMIMSTRAVEHAVGHIVMQCGNKENPPSSQEVDEHVVQALSTFPTLPQFLEQAKKEINEQ